MALRQPSMMDVAVIATWDYATMAKLGKENASGVLFVGV